MLLHQVLDVSILALLSLVDLLFAPQLGIIPQSLQNPSSISNNKKKKKKRKKKKENTEAAATAFDLYGSK